MQGGSGSGADENLLAALHNLQGVPPRFRVRPTLRQAPMARGNGCNPQERPCLFENSVDKTFRAERNRCGEPLLWVKRCISRHVTLAIAYICRREPPENAQHCRCQPGGPADGAPSRPSRQAAWWAPE